MRTGDRVGVAVSGGADSVALLRLLLELRGELGLVLAVVHFNHKIRGADADADERFVAELAAVHGLEFYCESSDTPLYARQRHLSLEAAGRDLRYAFFMNLLAGKLKSVATAHTMDDQAETVLLRIVRGAGTRGIAGIYPQLAVAGGTGHIVRPLLGIRRHEVRGYLKALDQPWREDASNLDVKHTRNRLRQELMPLIEREFNPSVVKVLAEMAEVARGEEEYWQELIGKQVPRFPRTDNSVPAEACRHEPGAPLDRRFLLDQPAAIQRRLLRAAAEAAGLRLEFDHVEKILDVAGRAQSVENKEVELPDGWILEGSSRELKFIPRSLSEQRQTCYEYRLGIPGEVEIRQLGMLLRVSVLPAERASSGYNRRHLLDFERLAPELLVRNWRPGDRFWPAHSKSPRKLKELLLRRRIPQPQRSQWPVVVSGEQIVWVPGIGAAALYGPDEGGRVVVIEEVTLGSPRQ